MLNLNPPIKAVLLLAIAALSTTLIIASSQRQSLTIDEANHLNCGTEWLQYHTYTIWPENPPLSRMAVALGPYLNGHRIEKPNVEKNKTYFDAFLSSYAYEYYYKGPIKDRLFWSRIFIIPFFLLSLVIVWTWTNSIAGTNAALIGTSMYAFLPAMLAHSGLGTTDVSFTSTFVLVLWTFVRWIEQPDYKNALWCGLAIALGLVTKFSILVFFPMCALPLATSWLIWGIKTSSFTYTTWLKSIFFSGLVLSVTTIVAWWAFFGFDTGLLGDQPMIQIGIKEGLWNKEIATVWVPAPEWVTGLLIVIEHHKVGALVFVNGQIATLGVPYFYLVTILLKTPIPFLIFIIAGLVGAWKSKAPRHWQARALAALPWLIAVLGLFSTINYGIRHILIVYPIGAVGAACGLIWLIEKYKVRTQQLIAGSLLIAQLVIAGIAYPNYLPYFNILAGGEPGEILNDSDMDWGQGLFELSDYCKENKIDTLWLSYQGLMNTCWYPDLPPIKVLPKDTVVSGWVAITEMHYRGVFHGQQFFSTPECKFVGFTFEPTPDFSPHKRFRWLDKYSLKDKVAGGSIRLYHVSNEANSQALRQE